MQRFHEEVAFQGDAYPLHAQGYGKDLLSLPGGGSPSGSHLPKDSQKERPREDSCFGQSRDRQRGQGDSHSGEDRLRPGPPRQKVAGPAFHRYSPE